MFFLEAEDFFSRLAAFLVCCYLQVWLAFAWAVRVATKFDALPYSHSRTVVKKHFSEDVVSLFAYQPFNVVGDSLALLRAEIEELLQNLNVSVSSPNVVLRKNAVLRFPLQKMLSVQRKLADGSTKVYQYETVGGKPINDYMRERLASERAHRVIHVSDISQATRNEIVSLRNQGLSWHAIAVRLRLSSYLVKKSFQIP